MGSIYRLEELIEIDDALTRERKTGESVDGAGRKTPI